MSNGASELVHCNRDSAHSVPVDLSVGCPSLADPAPGGDIQGSLHHSKSELRDMILQAEAAMKAMPVASPGRIGRIEIPTFHHFAPGVYMREIHIPKGAKVIGKIHKTTHLNILSRGSLALAAANGGEPRIVRASMVVLSEPGEKRLAEALEDSVWITVHPNPTDERDVLKLEHLLVVETFEQLEEHQKKQIEEKAPCPSSL